MDEPAMGWGDAVNYVGGRIPERELRWLAERATSLSYAALLAASAGPFTAEAWCLFCGWVDRIAAGEPFAYVVGDSLFRDRVFAVDNSVLIPRPETELLVDLVFAHVEGIGKPTILDLGTGTGAIAISLAIEVPNARVDAVDISAKALAVAKRNAKSHGVEIGWIESDWFGRVVGRYDIIVSNPPYVADDDPHLEALAFEPSLALVAGPEGLDAIAKIVDRARNHLSGWLFCEHGFEQASACRAMLRGAGYVDVESWFDQFGQSRVTGGRFVG